MLPLFFDLQGKDCLVTGDEHMAMTAKARLLAMAGARVSICSADMPHDFTGLPAETGFIAEPWQQLDLNTFTLVIGAFGKLQPAEHFCHAARRAGVLVNLVDRPELCDFQFPSIVNRSPLIIGISTGGAAPVFGQWLRGRLESLLPQGTGRVLEVARELRGKVGAAIANPAQRRKFWRKMAEDDLDTLAHMPPQGIKEHLLRYMEKLAASDDEKGSLWLVGVPVRPEDMNLKTLRLLQNADVVFRSSGLDDGYFDFARRDAELVEIASGTDFIQKAADHVAAGHILVWLHGKSKNRQSEIAQALENIGIDCRMK